MQLRLLSAALAVLPAFAICQDSLTLTDALRLAKQNNGAIRAAQFQLRASGSGVAIAQSSYFPTVTPNYQWQNQRSETRTGLGTQSYDSDGSTTGLNASWRFLDSGERDLSLRGSKRAFESQRFAARQTLRETLFTVQQQYYDALRAQELQKVADAQVARANTVLDQTKARVLVKDAAAKDILQAQADYLNAKVQALQARNKTASSSASLKATLGLPSERPLPILSAAQEPNRSDPEPMAVVIDEGLKLRSDLEARRLSLQSQDFTLRRLRRESSWTFGLDGNLAQQFTPDRLQNRTLTFLFSYPLFDGGYLKQTANQTRYQIEANKADLAQAERQASAEIESAYIELQQNRERLDAAKVAADAARENYQAAVESQRMGAGNVIEVLTAQVSLVTAESNSIEALYDLLISQARLQLVAGRTLEGE